MPRSQISLERKQDAMRGRFYVGLVIALVLLGVLLGPVAVANEPVFRLRTNGLTQDVFSLDWADDGQTLLIAGDGKQVDVFRYEGERLLRDHGETLRQPIDAGVGGIIRTMDVCSNGRFVAVAGVGATKDSQGIGDRGFIANANAFGDKNRSQWGTVTVFDRKTNQSYQLPMHHSPVHALALVETGDANNPMLLTLGERVVGSADAPTQDNLFAAKQMFLAGRTLLGWKGAPLAKAWESWPRNQSAGPSRPAIYADWEGPALRVTTKTFLRSQPLSALYSPANNSIDSPRPLPGSSQSSFAVSADPQLGQVLTERQELLSVKQHAVPWSGNNLRLALSDQDTPREIHFVPNSDSFVMLSKSSKSGRPNDWWIKLINKRSLQPITSNSKLFLNSARQPVIAVSGSRIAIATSSKRLVEIHSLSRLGRGVTQPIDVIASETLVPRKVSLLLAQGSQGPRDLGLQFHLSTSRPNESRMFHLLVGKLGAGGGNATVLEDSSIREPTFPSLSHPDFPKAADVVAWRRVRLDLEFGTDFLVVSHIARSDENRPLLEIFDAQTGKRIRRLQGHEVIVRRIGATREPARLVTTSDDGVTSVWDLDDMDTLVGRRAALPEIRLSPTKTADGFRVLTTAPAMGLNAGDSLIGLSHPDGRPIELPKHLAQLKRRILDFAVGSKLTMTIRRNEGLIQLPVTLEQAADATTPIMSVAIFRLPQPLRAQLGVQASLPSWLAWTPAGAFESSDRFVERLAGWHFNPAEMKGAVRFASLAEYRDDFFGQGLIPRVLQSGHVPNVWPPAQPLSIKTTLLDDTRRVVQAAPGSVLPQKEIKQARIRVEYPPPGAVDGVSMRVDGKQVIELQRSKQHPGVWETKDPNLDIAADQKGRIEIEVQSKRLPGGKTEQPYLVIPNLPTQQAVPQNLGALQAPIVLSCVHRRVVEINSGGGVFTAPVRVRGTLSGPIPPTMSMIIVDDQGRIAPLSVNGTRFEGTVEARPDSREFRLVFYRDNRVKVARAIGIQVIDRPTVVAAPELLPVEGGFGRVQVRLRSLTPINPAGVAMTLHSRADDFGYHDVLYGEPVMIGPEGGHDQGYYETILMFDPVSLRRMSVFRQARLWFQVDPLTPYDPSSVLGAFDFSKDALAFWQAGIKAEFRADLRVPRSTTDAIVSATLKVSANKPIKRITIGHRSKGSLTQAGVNNRLVLSGADLGQPTAVNKSFPVELAPGLNEIGVVIRFQDDTVEYLKQRYQIDRKEEPVAATNLIVKGKPGHQVTAQGGNRWRVVSDPNSNDVASVDVVGRFDTTGLPRGQTFWVQAWANGFRVDSKEHQVGEQPIVEFSNSVPIISENCHCMIRVVGLPNDEAATLNELDFQADRVTAEFAVYPAFFQGYQGKAIRAADALPREFQQQGNVKIVPNLLTSNQADWNNPNGLARDYASELASYPLEDGEFKLLLICLSGKVVIRDKQFVLMTDELDRAMGDAIQASDPRALQDLFDDSNHLTATAIKRFLGNIQGVGGTTLLMDVAPYDQSSKEAKLPNIHEVGVMDREQFLQWKGNASSIIGAVGDLLAYGEHSDVVEVASFTSNLTGNALPL